MHDALDRNASFIYTSMVAQNAPIWGVFFKVRNLWQKIVRNHHSMVQKKPIKFDKSCIFGKTTQYDHEKPINFDILKNPLISTEKKTHYFRRFDRGQKKPLISTKKKPLNSTKKNPLISNTLYFKIILQPGDL